MRKNILIIAHSHEPQFVDIYNQYTRLFDPKKYCVTVLYLTTDARPDLQEKTLAEHVIFSGIKKRKLRFLKISPLLSLLKLCKKHRYQMVICHRYKPTYLMLWVAKLCRIPKIIFVMHAIGTMKSVRRRIFITKMMQSNMLLAGVSNAVRDDLRRSLPRVPTKQIVTLYNAIDVGLTEPQLLTGPEARALIGIPEDIFAFGHVGRFEKNKDQRTLIKAFALIHQHCPSAKLYLVGSGVLEEELKTLVEQRGLQEKIIFTGRIPYAFRLMKAFNCFVLSSSQEAFGRVLLEAMIAKVPVIGTHAYGIPEVIGTSGKIVRSRDPKALGDAMLEVYMLSQDQLSAMGDEAYKHVVGNFALPNFRQQFSKAMQII